MALFLLKQVTSGNFSSILLYSTRKFNFLSCVKLFFRTHENALLLQPQPSPNIRYLEITAHMTIKLTLHKFTTSAKLWFHALSSDWNIHQWTKRTVTCGNHSMRCLSNVGADVSKCFMVLWPTQSYDFGAMRRQNPTSLTFAVLRTWTPQSSRLYSTMGLPG